VDAALSEPRRRFLLVEVVELDVRGAAAVASFIGSPAMNFLDARLRAATLQLGDWTIELPEALRSAVGTREGEVLVGLRPENFALANSSEATVRIPAEIQITEQLGPELLVHFRAEGLSVANPEALRAERSTTRTLRRKARQSSRASRRTPTSLPARRWKSSSTASACSSSIP
jgi:ABC-type sugar transport system ATPase subunit